jgi:hypothetical protein
MGYLAQSFVAQNLDSAERACRKVGADVYSSRSQRVIPGSGKREAMMVRNPGSGRLNAIGWRRLSWRLHVAADINKGEIQFESEHVLAVLTACNVQAHGLAIDHATNKSRVKQDVCVAKRI